MPDSIKILVFDEDESLLEAISQGRAYPAGLDIRQVNHINDLILALDEYEPHIVVVNEKLSSYESLSVLAIAKKRGQDLPYILFFDDTLKVRTVKRQSALENIPHFGEIIPAIEDILMDMSRKQDALAHPFQGGPFKETFEKFSVFSDYTFLLSQEYIILMYSKKPHLFSPAPDDEFRGCHFEDILSLFFDKKILLKVQLELITKQSFEIELWNGKEERRAYYSVRGITLADGVKIIGLQDLTPYKAAEDLSLSRNKILDSLTLGVILLDLDEQIVFINQYARTTFNLEHSEIIGKSFDEIIPLKFTDTSLLQMKKSLYEEGAWKGKTYFRDQQHHKIELTLRAALQRSPADQVTGILLLFEPAAADSSFSGLTTDYRSIVEQMPQGIFVLEEENLVFANDHFCKMLGYVDQEELIGIRFSNLVEDKDIPEYSHVMSEIRNYDELSAEFEIRFSHKNGINRIYGHLTLNLMQAPSGFTVIGTISDITERKLREEIVPNTAQEYSSENPIRGNEHDLRTYLNAILGFADILKEQSKDFADQSMSVYTEHIYASGKKLLQLMEETAVLKEDAVVQNGLRRESIDLTDIINEVIEQKKDAAARKNLKLASVSSGETFIVGDRRFLSDALSRLVLNSIMAVDEGTILVDCGYDAIKHNVYLRIKDNRPIIPEALIGKLFDPVVEDIELLDDCLRDTNVTLSVVKRVLESMNGKIELQSSQIAGTIVYLQLPMDEEKTGNANTGPNVYYTISPDVIYLNDLRPYILIIEDDPGSSKMLEITLRNVAKLEIAANGDDALYIIEQKFEQGILFDVVLIDIGLPPPWNGITLFQHLRHQYSGYAQIPFIAETAFALRDDREKILASGFAGFLSKPIDRRYLIKTIASIIRKKRGDEEPKYETYYE